MVDKKLFRIQSLVYDPIAPLSTVLHKFDKLTAEQEWEAVQATVTLLGNASAHISQLCQRKLLNVKVHYKRCGPGHE